METTPNNRSNGYDKNFDGSRSRFGLSAIIATIAGLLALGWIVAMTLSGSDRPETAHRTGDNTEESTSPTSGKSEIEDDADFGFDAPDSPKDPEAYDSEKQYEEQYKEN